MPNIPPSLATLLVGLVGGFLLLYVHRKNARRTASAKFRAEFLKVLSGLYPVATNWPSNIDSHLRQIFPALQLVLAEFRPYVPWYKRRAYDRAWFVYRLGRDGRDIDQQMYHQYMGFTSPGTPPIDPKQTFRANVKRLLDFADET